MARARVLRRAWTAIAGVSASLSERVRGRGQARGAGHALDAAFALCFPNESRFSAGWMEA